MPLPPVAAPATAGLGEKRALGTVPVEARSAPISDVPEAQPVDSQRTPSLSGKEAATGIDLRVLRVHGHIAAQVKAPSVASLYQNR